jgi:hypothetical protein
MDPSNADPISEPTSAPERATAPEPQPGAAPASVESKKRAVRKKKKLSKKVQQYFKAKEAGRVGYAQADRLLDEISAEVKPGREIQLYDDKGDPAQKAQLVDLFNQGKNIIWKPCGVRRYDLALVK